MACLYNQLTFVVFSPPKKKTEEESKGEYDKCQRNGCCLHHQPSQPESSNESVISPAEAESEPSSRMKVAKRPRKKKKKSDGNDSPNTSASSNDSSMEKPASKKAKAAIENIQPGQPARPKSAEELEDIIIEINVDATPALDGKKHQCSDCNQRFSKPYLLKQHFLRYHQTDK